MKRTDDRGRYPVADLPPSIDMVRNFPRTYDVDLWTGRAVSVVPDARWARGALVRSSQPAFALASRAPMFDPSAPEQWVDPRD